MVQDEINLDQTQYQYYIKVISENCAMLVKSSNRPTGYLFWPIEQQIKFHVQTEH